MDQSDVFCSKAQVPALYLGVVMGVSPRLHDLTQCVLLETLKDVNDFMRQYVPQKTRYSDGSQCVEHAIVE